MVFKRCTVLYWGANDIVTTRRGIGSIRGHCGLLGGVKGHLGASGGCQGCSSCQGCIGG